MAQGGRPTGRFTPLSKRTFPGPSMEWRNLAALKPYLSRGQMLEIAPEGRYKIRPEVQDF